ncbi:MAG: response regulator [Bacteroidetes bacterium]|nr:response regulator [Bacteroidota bacterium]MBS1540826.1 response regulator [Bacteroidota bacterium]
MSSPSILVIDDEAPIRKMLEITLQSNGYRVAMAENAKEGMLTAASHPPDIILLDLGLPDKSGHEVLKLLREWYSNPIIILSILNSEEDIVAALDNGANDYLVKPFRTGELLARIRSVLRQSALDENSPVVEFGDLFIDFGARIVKKYNRIIKLTATEYSLLILMAKAEGKVLTHHHLLNEVWGPSYKNESQYLRVFVAQLRKKIETNPNNPTHILTEPGVGYRFVSK